MVETKVIQGTSVPSIGLGTYGLRGKECETSIESALTFGYRHFDTAQMYNNEENIGNALKRSKISRDEIYITTKVWPTNFTREKFLKSVQQSLKDLNMQQVDLLLLHWPSDPETNLNATDFLLECLHLNYARKIGVSNFSILQLEKSRKQAPIFCNQLLYNPFDQNVQMLRYMQSNELLLTAYSPLALGRYANHATLKNIGQKYNKTPVQVALRWLIQQPNIAAIPKAALPKHQQENLEVFDFTLSEEDMQSVQKLTH